ncbi:MAG: selenide, water dikinase SelD [Promethearchaeota archaeon]
MEDVGLFREYEDAAVDPIPGTNPPLSLVRNLDVFTPLVDDPFITGQITACNVTNDIFAANCREVTGFLVFLGVPLEMPPDVPRGILRGIKAFARKIGTRVSGGHTIHSGWPLVGGEACGIEETSKLVPKNRGVRPGDVLLLTKPLGTQPAMAAERVRTNVAQSSAGILDDVPADLVDAAVRHAFELMTASLKPVVEAVHALDDWSGLHGTTDVTGFGLVGTVEEVLEGTGLFARLDQVPVIEGTPEIAEALGYPLEEARSAETAGPMLLVVSPDAVGAVVEQCEIKGVRTWRVGRVEGPPSDQLAGKCVLDDDARVLRVSRRESR